MTEPVGTPSLSSGQPGLGTRNWLVKYRWAIWLFIIFDLLLFGWTIGVNNVWTSFDSSNFPLEQKWSLRLGGAVKSLSVIDDGMVLARTPNALYALDVVSGKVIWRKGLSWQADPQPAFGNDSRVYVVDAQGVKALRRTDGALVWQQPLYEIDGSVKDLSGRNLLVADGGYVNIYDAVRGGLLRSEPICRQFDQAYFSGNRVYAPCDGILGIDLSTGEAWWWKKGEGLMGSVGYGDGMMYYSPSDSAMIVALDPNNREELWRTPLAIDGSGRFRVSGETLVMTDAAKLCALKRSNGLKFWCADASSPQNPTVIRATVYAFDADRQEITAFGVVTGKIIGTLKLTRLNFSSASRQLMVSAEGLLLFANGREVFAFGK